MGLPRVVIVGGGFGGLHTAQRLRTAAVEVILIDRTNHHLFQPLLYQVASSSLAPRDIAYPIREILKKQANTSVMMDEVIEVDSENKSVVCASGRRVAYDYLVIAAGTRHSYFGHPEWEEFAPGLKTLGDGIAIRNRILTAFEEAEVADEKTQVERLMTFVIVGGGPTGVELAGAIAEIAQKTMLRNFRKIDPSDTKVYLVEGGPRVLPSYPEALSCRAQQDLSGLGVTVLTGSLVTHIEEKGVTLGEKVIETENVFWAAGNEAPSFLRTLEAPVDRQGRIIVGPNLTVPGHPEIFVIGDAAHAKDQTGAPLPGIAPVAIQQGAYVGEAVTRRLGGGEIKPFRYRDKGAMATIGKAKAVAFIAGRQFTGFFAWILWSLVHIAFLIGFRNRLVVMLEWLFWYVTESRGSRLIQGSQNNRGRNG